MRDDNAVGLIVIENRMDGAKQLQPVLVDQSVAGQAAERNFLDGRDVFQLRDSAQQLSVVEPLPGLDVPGQVQPVGADRIDGAAGDDQANSW